jgi:3-deoxy-D-manno-octulosonic-acid transferase
LPALTRASLARIGVVAAQSEDDALRLAELGARDPHVTGNLKFDITPPADLLARGAVWKAQWDPRPVLLAASTREGEEAPLLRAFAETAPAEALLVIVPRHPQRFDEVARLIEAAGLSYQRRSDLDGKVLHDETRVLLGDSLGELFAYYEACDVAFVGGSLAPLGGQNLIEPASVGRPVLVGPHTFNFEEATQRAITAGAALRVADAAQLMREALTLLNDASRRACMGKAGLAYAARHGGAAQRVARLIAPLLKPR